MFSTLVGGRYHIPTNNSFAAIVDIDDNVVSFLLFSNLIAYENHFGIDVFLAKYHAIVDNNESLILIDSY